MREEFRGKDTSYHISYTAPDDPDKKPDESDPEIDVDYNEDDLPGDGDDSSDASKD